jgi:hypothetical protein
MVKSTGSRPIEFKDPDLNPTWDYNWIGRIILLIMVVLFIAYIFYGLLNDSHGDVPNADAGVNITYHDSILYINYTKLNDNITSVVIMGVDEGQFVGNENYEIYREEHVGNFTTQYFLNQTKVNTFVISFSNKRGDLISTEWYALKRNALGFGTVYKM